MIHIPHQTVNSMCVCPIHGKIPATNNIEVTQQILLSDWNISTLSLCQTYKSDLYLMGWNSFIWFSMVGGGERKPPIIIMQYST